MGASSARSPGLGLLVTQIFSAADTADVESVFSFHGSSLKLFSTALGPRGDDGTLTELPENRFLLSQLLVAFLGSNALY